MIYALKYFRSSFRICGDIREYVLILYGISQNHVFALCDIEQQKKHNAEKFHSKPYGFKKQSNKKLLISENANI
jgi:hypothetical protein